MISKRAWSHPAQVRKDLEGLLGAVEKITRIKDLHPEFAASLKQPAARGLVPRVSRVDMKAIVIEPQIKAEAVPFYAKLRAEAEAELLTEGAGTLYIGFHLDPFHQASWNNILPHFEQIDRNGDRLLDAAELSVVADWLNHHHRSSVPANE